MSQLRRFRPLDMPELNVALFGALLNFPWEMWQAPLYEGMAEASHLSAVTRCSWATLGDAVILVLAFAAVSMRAHSRNWVLQPTRMQAAMFVAAGLAVTLVLELIATRLDLPIWTWRYAAAMPVLPLLGVGVAPLAQWLVVPLATLWCVGRHLRGGRA